MLKKLFVVVSIGVLFCTSMQGVFAVSSEEFVDEDKAFTSSLLMDDLDQFQDVAEQDILLPVGAPPPVFGVQINFSSAQSFIPQKEVLSRVELLLARNTTTIYPLTVWIAESLFSPPLTGVQIPPHYIPDQVFEWINVDFPDVSVVIGQTYYIILTTVNYSNNFYGWAGNTNGFSYMDGSAWMSTNDGKTWGNSSCPLVNNDLFFKPRFISNTNSVALCSGVNGTWDMCFRTFGRNEAPEVYITKPLNAVYLANDWLFEFSEIVIIGLIRIEIEAFDQTGVDRVEFYIDDNYVGESVEAPYYYLWSDREFFKHFIRIEVFDSLGLKTVKELEVWKFF